MDSLAARPPLFIWFVERVIGWNILVWACASPLMIATWPGSAGGIGEVCAVVAWTVAIVAWDQRLRWHGSVSAQRILRIGGCVLFVVHAAVFALQNLVAATGPSPLLFFLMYSPVVLVASWLPLIPNDASDFYAYFVLTILSGGQAFLTALAMGHLIEKVRPTIRCWTRRR
jgi:hypothetical protein